jgi:alcohol dehydrogenase
VEQPSPKGQEVLIKVYATAGVGVCSSANVALVHSLGAGRVLDYTKEEGLSGGERYALIFDAVGKAKSSLLKVQCKTALTPQGTYLSVDDGRP